MYIPNAYNCFQLTQEYFETRWTGRWYRLL